MRRKFRQCARLEPDRMINAKIASLIRLPVFASTSQSISRIKVDFNFRLEHKLNSDTLSRAHTEWKSFAKLLVHLGISRYDEWADMIALKNHFTFHGAPFDIECYRRLKLSILLFSKLMSADNQSSHRLLGMRAMRRRNSHSWHKIITARLRHVIEPVGV